MVRFSLRQKKKISWYLNWALEKSYNLGTRKRERLRIPGDRAGVAQAKDGQREHSSCQGQSGLAETDIQRQGERRSGGRDTSRRPGAEIPFTFH